MASLHPSAGSMKTVCFRRFRLLLQAFPVVWTLSRVCLPRSFAMRPAIEDILMRLLPDQECEIVEVLVAECAPPEGLYETVHPLDPAAAYVEGGA